MVCPKCKGKLKVIDSMDVSQNEVYRRKKCLNCGHLLYTCEFEVEATKLFKKEWNMYKTTRSKGI